MSQPQIDREKMIMGQNGNLSSLATQFLIENHVIELLKYHLI